MRFTLALAGAAGALLVAAMPALAAESSFKVFDPSLLDRSVEPCQDL